MRPKMAYSDWFGRENNAEIGNVMTEVLQKRLPYDPFDQRPLPGIMPLEIGDWLRVDEAFAGQMTRRADLISTSRKDVLFLDECAKPAARELLSLVVEEQLAKPGFVKGEGGITRPDGGFVALDYEDPLASVGQLAQEDFCILQKSDASGEHILTGAVLCFPASWSLKEKAMRPLTGIHAPVESYDQNIARRVQRLFDGVQVARPLWRFNALWYADAELHQPRREEDRRADETQSEARFLRSELQTIRRLPKTQAVIFGIHTFVLEKADVVGAE